MKVRLDTNIIVDVAIEREPFFEESNQVLSLVQLKQVEGYVSASTFGDLYYIIRKVRGREWTLEFLTTLATICQVATVDSAAIALALTSNLKDFEDAIQYNRAIINHLDAIVTRNSQNFTNVALRILTPNQLIQQLES